MMIGFYVSFATVLPDGEDTHRLGWWVPGDLMLSVKSDRPSYEFDPEDGDLIEWAANLLKEHGAIYPSQEPVTSPAVVWMHTDSEVLSYETGETIVYSYHFHGFTDEQIEQVIEEALK